MTGYVVAAGKVRWVERMKVLDRGPQYSEQEPTPQVPLYSRTARERKQVATSTHARSSVWCWAEYSYLLLRPAAASEVCLQYQ